MSIGETIFVQACPTGSDLCTAYDLTLDSITPQSNGTSNVKFSYVMKGYSYVEDTKVSISVNGAVKWSDTFRFPFNKTSKTVSVPASTGDTIRIKESLTGTLGTKNIYPTYQPGTGLEETVVNASTTATVPAPKIQSVNTVSYSVSIGVNSATPKLTVSNPNGTSVSFKSKVTVDGTQRNTKTVPIPAGGQASVSYDLSFSVGPGSSASHNICIVPVSTS